MKLECSTTAARRRLPLVLLLGVAACAADVDAPGDLGASQQDLRGGNKPSQDADAGSGSEQGPGNGGGGLTGNGAPSGSHYTLNIIGVPKEKSADLTGNNGRRIFVPLQGNSKIMLSEGDFQVLDANGTDGEAAFQLPNPDPENDGVTEYSVYARALGTPGGSSTTTTCATDPTTGEVYCSVESMVLVRNRGRNKFDNVSRELLYIYADLDGDGNTERVALFGDELTDYFWQYDNNGLRVAQLRFYPIASDVN